MAAFNALSLLTVLMMIVFSVLSIRHLSELGRAVHGKHWFQPGFFAGPKYFTRAGWIYKLLAFSSAVLYLLFCVLHGYLE